MWTIIKFDKKYFQLLKKDLESKIGSNISFYKPSILIKKKIFNKEINKEINILGDYIFCFHKNFRNSTIKKLKYSRGLKYFLDGFEKSQEEIDQFIKKCKENENQSGFIKQEFFNDILLKKYKFISGPFVNKIFKIIEMGRYRNTIMIGNIRTVVNKNKNCLYQPI